MIVLRVRGVRTDFFPDQKQEASHLQCEGGRSSVMFGAVGRLEGIKVLI